MLEERYEKERFYISWIISSNSILAILVIIALPNVINMYNRAQKQTFLTEAKKVYSESKKNISQKNNYLIKNRKLFF